MADVTRELRIAWGLSRGMTYSALGLDLGISRQRVQQIAKKFAVRSVNARGRIPRAKAKREIERPEGTPGILWDESVRRGFLVRRSLQRNNLTDVSRLQINGKLCFLHVVTNGSAGYHHMSRTRDRVRKADFRIVMAGTSWFIFPEGILAEKSSYHLPARPVIPYKNHVAKIAWEDYREAWWRLAK